MCMVCKFCAISRNFYFQKLINFIFIFSVFTLYNDQHYICLIHHPGEKTTIQFTEIHMYSVNKDLSTVTKTHILQTNFNGSNGLAMHAIDDILAIHDRYVNKKKYQKKN